MKTSNKILLVFLLAMFFSAASLMLYAKAHMIEGTPGMDDYYYGDGKVIEKTMLDDLSINNLELGDNFTYSIDPTRTDVTIKGDSTFISKLSVVMDDQFRILTGGVGHNFKWPDNVFVTVGVKNLDSLKLDINGNARVSATGPLQYGSMDMYIEGNARCNFDLTVDHLEIRSNGNGRLTLEGSTSELVANSNGNSKLNFENCQLNSANLGLNGNARFYGDVVNNLSAHANGNAKVTFNEVTGKSNTSANGNARFTIRN